MSRPAQFVSTASPCTASPLPKNYYISLPPQMSFIETLNSNKNTCESMKTIVRLQGSRVELSFFCFV
jgi:hypothetical protein